jgi:hypothetical protein
MATSEQGKKDQCDWKYIKEFEVEEQEEERNRRKPAAVPSVIFLGD